MRGPTTDTVYRGDVARLLRRIDERFGLDLTRYRLSYVERRLASRVRALGLHSYRQYGHYLERDPAEYGRMVRTLTINVTEFFRDPSVYAVFRERVIPGLLASKAGRGGASIRVWSAGCATGEEPYSVAMTLLAELGRAPAIGVEVVGSDLDPDALEMARAGWYEDAKLAKVPRAMMARFMRRERGGHRVSEEVAGVVTFEAANLFSDRPPGSFDVVFCRNVFIYLTRIEQGVMLDAFAEALAPDGFLVLGRSEKLTPDASARFEALTGTERVYRMLRRPCEGGDGTGVE